MKNKQGLNFKKQLISAGVGVLTALTVAAVFLALEAALILNEIINLSAANFIAIVSHIISVYVGCLLAGRKAEAKLFVMSGVLGASILMHTVLSVLLFDTGLGHILRVALPELLGFCLALLTPAGKGSNRKTKRVMKRYL